MPSLTYRRLADIVAWAGLVPHFCEVDAARLCITAETARPCVNENTALILGVHPIVNCCDAEGLEALSAQTGIPLLFDSVESVYETLNGRRVGTFGRAECFSMHASKLINAFEGGYVTTNDAELAARLRTLRTNRSTDALTIRTRSMDAMQNEIHAAMALAGLDCIDEHIELNRRRYYRYKIGLRDVPGLRLLNFDERERNGFKNIVVELTTEWPLERETTLELLHKEKLLCRAYYSPALHQKPTGYPTVHGDLSQSEALARRYMTLPSGYLVSEDDVDSICGLLGAIQSYGQSIAARTANAHA
jgi:dTDP-4-amino-4,6-dideoxygalactose transaminase